MISFRQGRQALAQVDKEFKEEQDFIYDVISESLGNVQLLAPLLKTLKPRAGQDALDAGYNGRSNRSLAAIGKNSEVVKIGEIQIPVPDELQATIRAIGYADRTAEQNDTYARLSAEQDAWLNKANKLALSTARKRNDEGFEPFGTVFVVDGRTQGMLWNTELTLGSTKSISTGINVKGSWSYARTDSMWTGSKSVRQRNYSATNRWDKWRHVQVPTTLGTKSEVVGAIIYELMNTYPGGKLEVYGVYPDTESFKIAAARLANRPVTDVAAQGRALKTDLVTSALDKKYGSVIEKAKSAFKDRAQKVAADVSSAMEKDMDRREWEALMNRIEGLKNSAGSLRRAISLVNGRKDQLSMKATGRVSYRDISDEEIDKALQDIRFI